MDNNEINRLTNLALTKLESLEIEASRNNIQAIKDCMNIYYNGFGVKKSIHKAYKYLYQAAILWDIDTILNVAYMYDHGIYYPQSDDKAVEWYWTAAILGSQEAINELNNMGIPY